MCYNIYNIKSGTPTLKPNYLKLPVTRVDSVDEFNEIYLFWNKREKSGKIKFGIDRTPSGGISTTRLIDKLPLYDVKTGKNGAELVVLASLNGAPAYYRIQYRTYKISEDKKMCGRIAFNKLYDEFKRDGVKLDDFYIENGEEVKKTIEPPIIAVLDSNYFDVSLIVNHIDIHSSYPSGIAKFDDRLRPTIERLYRQRESEPINKVILNMACGFFQSSTYFKARLAQISKFAIEENNKKIRYMIDWLKGTGRLPIAVNTDGIWFAGKPTGLNGSNLGEFYEDHTNCRIRFKSAGCYEYIENGEYHPVVRGMTKLDAIKPREQWSWGDIYNFDAEPIKFVFDRERGIINAKDS